MIPPYHRWRLENPQRAEEFIVSCGGHAEAEAAWYTLYAEGEAEAVARERPRCTAHAALGVACQNVSLAIEAIQSGATVESMLDRYLAAAFRTRNPNCVEQTQELAASHRRAA